MNLWEILLYLNLAMGILSCVYYARQRGEVLLGDLYFMLIIMLFGCVTMWSYLYDEYAVQIHNFLDNMSNLGKKPLWRSRSTIAKEVLYGEKNNE